MTVPSTGERGRSWGPLRFRIGVVIIALALLAGFLSPSGLSLPTASILGLIGGILIGIGLILIVFRGADKH
jgi:formate/nitrite transporter FocA (FNT family)